MTPIRVWTRERVDTDIREMVADTLRVDEDEVVPTARLQADLGAESIDFLDLVFRLERTFGMKIPRGELFPESVFQGDPEMVQNGKVTKKGLAELRRCMPDAELTAFKKNPDISMLSDLFTVGMVTKFVCRKLGISQ